MIAYQSDKTAQERMREFLERDFFAGTHLPLTFTYNGISSRECLKGWKFEKTSDGISYTAPDGLRAAVEIREIKNFPAVEWLLTFENTGKADSAHISEVNALDIYVEAAPFRTAGTQQYGNLDNILYYNGGSDCKADDFIPCQEVLHHISARERMSFECTNGRPTSGSHGAFPYFNLKTLDRGIFFAFGWSGQWAMELSCRQHETEGDPDCFRFAGGMPGVDTILHPGEKIRTAKILLMTWDGTIDDSHDMSRQLILQEHTPKINGKPAMLPVSYGSWGSRAEKNHAELDNIAKANLPAAETYWVDAGWYGPAGTRCEDSMTNDWSDNVGYYDEDMSRYPEGMGAIGKHAHEIGQRFLLWFEPDRAAPGTQMRVEHPEFYLPAPEDSSAMLDLGREDAYQWMLKMLSERIERFHLDVLRIDYNFAPLGQWRDNDAPDRKGMTEIRAVTNFYRLWDELLARFPHLLIDNCASGGRRLDFEACTRSVPLFRTDFFCYADCNTPGVETQTAGLAPFVPLTGTSLSGKAGADPSWYNFIGFLSAGFSISAGMAKKAAEDPDYRADLSKKLTMLARYRELLCGDFRMLTTVSIDERDWYAYELFDRKQGKGCVVSTRRAECPMMKANYILRFAEKGESYRLEDAETGVTWVVSGEELIENGLTVELPKRETASLLFVEKM